MLFFFWKLLRFHRSEDPLDPQVRDPGPVQFYNGFSRHESKDHKTIRISHAESNGSMAQDNGDSRNLDVGSLAFWVRGARGSPVQLLNDSKPSAGCSSSRRLS